MGALDNIINSISDKLLELNDRFLDKILKPTVLESESMRLEASKKWLPKSVRIYKKINPDYEINPYDYTLPLKEPFYSFFYVKKFKPKDMLVLVDTFEKYSKSNADTATSLDELSKYRGFGLHKRKLFHQAQLHMIASGDPLAETLDKFMGDLIDRRLLRSIKVGMESNTLTESLEAYKDDLLYDIRNNSKIKKAAIYPITVIILIIGMCIGGKFFLADSLIDTLGMTNYPNELMPLVNIANIFLQPKKFITLVVAILFAKHLYSKYTSVRLMVEMFLLKIPVLNNFLITKDICYFFRSLYSYIDSQTPSIEAHEKSCDSLKLLTLKLVFESKITDIMHGAKLSEVYADISFVDITTKMTLSVSERHGDLAESIKLVTNLLKESYQETTDNLVANMPTVAIIIAGIIIMIVFLPVMSLMSNLDNYIN